MITRGNSTNNNNFKILEKNWNERFYLEKIPNYDSLKDSNILGLNLIKSKIQKNEFQLREFQKKIKKSKTNSSNLTMGNKTNRTLNIPLLVTNIENEKLDLFSLKCNNYVPLTLAGQNSIKTDYNKKALFKRMYNDIYDLKKNITEQNSRIIMMNNNFQEKMKELKELWKLLGVTPDYQINFWKILSKHNEKENIDKFLSFEKNEMIQLKTDLEKLKKEISKRENDVYKLRQLDLMYDENENILNSYKTNDSNKENEEKYNKYNENKNKLETDIENLLKSLRLHTINTVCMFSKFRNQYNYYFTSGKININLMTNGYEFNNDYLIKIKSDTNFLINSSLANLYDFSKFQNDPFFISLLKKSEENTEYKYLEATEDTLNKIHQCMFIIDQEEIMHKMAQKKMFNKKSSFVKINQNIFGTNLKKDIQSLNRKKIKKLLFNSEKQIKSGNQSPLFNIALTEYFKNNKIKNNSNI